MPTDFGKRCGSDCAACGYDQVRVLPKCEKRWNFGWDGFENDTPGDSGVRRTGTPARNRFVSWWCGADSSNESVRPRPFPLESLGGPRYTGGRGTVFHGGSGMTMNGRRWSAAGLVAIGAVGFALGTWNGHGREAAAQSPGGVVPAAATSDYSQRVVAYIYDNIPVTREDLGEFLIARYGQ